VPALPRGPAGAAGGSDSSPSRGILGTPELRQECFAAEARDPTWATEAEEQVLAAFSRGARASGVLADKPGVECRATLCELQVSSRPPGNQAEAAADIVAWQSLVDEIRRDAAFVAAFDPDAIGLGTGGMTAHRRGHRLHHGAAG
jgi:hypothetical protein